MTSTLSNSRFLDLDATITKRGQATIPVAVRRLLNIGPYDRITFRIDPAKKHITLRPAMTLEGKFGSVKPLGTEKDDFRHVTQIAKDEHIARVTKDLKIL